MPNNTEMLNTGTYTDVWFPCATAQVVEPPVPPSVIGTLLALRICMISISGPAWPDRS